MYKANGKYVGNGSLIDNGDGTQSVQFTPPYESSPQMFLSMENIATIPFDTKPPQHVSHLQAQLQLFCPQLVGRHRYHSTLRKLIRRVLVCDCQRCIWEKCCTSNVNGTAVGMWALDFTPTSEGEHTAEFYFMDIRLEHFTSDISFARAPSSPPVHSLIPRFWDVRVKISFGPD